MALRKVKEGDVIKIGRKRFIFTKTSALLFNDALFYKQEEGIWPLGEIVLLRYSDSKRPYKVQLPFPIEEIAKAVSKTQQVS